VKLKELLNVYGYDFYEQDIHTNDQAKKVFKDSGFTKVPQVFVERGKVAPSHIGGYDTTKDYLRKNFFTGHPRQDEIIKELEELDG